MNNYAGGSVLMDGLLPRVRKLKILVQVIEPIAEICESPSEEGQHLTISERAKELQEESAHALVELIGLAAQYCKSLPGEFTQELLRVDLRREPKQHKLR